jgi:hypothetical protein
MSVNASWLVGLLVNNKRYAIAYSPPAEASNSPLRTPDRKAAHSASEKVSLGPEGSFECRISTDSPTNATSTHSLGFDTVLFRHKTRACSGSATLPPSLRRGGNVLQPPQSRFGDVLATPTSPSGCSADPV